MQPLFHIRNLECAYSNGPTILRMNEVEIPREKLIFVVGKSGIGKSTFIETLGLMNNTIKDLPNTEVNFFADIQSQPVDMKKIWKDESISKIRRDHLSFIFQNTNLMSNFTAGENMMTSMLIGGGGILEAKSAVLEVMKSLDLKEELFDKPITELSGGQRQRLAFVRAITSKFSLLFGDEPTGNLDQNTASYLMTMLKERIVNDKKSGIIVSHDMELAEKFGDVIIPIFEQKLEDGKSSGSIEQLNFLRNVKGAWQTESGEPIANISEHLRHILNGETLVSE